MIKPKYILLIISLIIVAKFANAQKFEVHKTLTEHQNSQKQFFFSKTIAN